MNEHQNLLRDLIGHEIKVVYPGPHTIQGLLVDIKDDFLVLKNETDLTHYINLAKIKELTKNTKTELHDLKDIEFVDKPNFHELLKSFENEWLIVSRDGTEAIQGFLSNVHHVYITFIVNDEISFIPISQIATGASNLVKKQNPVQPPASNDNKTSTEIQVESMEPVVKTVKKDDKKEKKVKKDKSDKTEQNVKKEEKVKENKNVNENNNETIQPINIGNSNRLNKLAEEILNKQLKKKNNEKQAQQKEVKTDQQKENKEEKKQKETTKKKSTDKYQKKSSNKKELTPQQVMRNRRRARERRKASGK